MGSSANDATLQKECGREYLATDHLMDDLGRRVVRGGFIATVAQFLRMALTLMVSAILSRLLTPEDFGLVAMAATVTIFMQLFTDLGLSTATVQSEKLDQDAVSALFFINLVAGGFVALAAVAASPLAAAVFGDPPIFPLAAAMALTIPLAAATAQHNALLQRGMRWLTIQWIALAALGIGSAAGILLAWRTELGYWALVAQALATALSNLVLTWVVCPWRPGRKLRWSAAASALNFGLHLGGFNFINYFHRQLDNLLIGWRWGTEELGHYARAYQLLTLPLTLVSGPVASAIVPALSRLQDDPDRWRKTFLKAFGAVNIVSSGVTVLLVVCAKPLVEFLYGPAWSKAADIFALLAISMFAATPMNASGWIYVSLGKTRRMLKWGLIAIPIYVLAFFLGLPFGAGAVALSYSIAVLLTAIPCLAFAAHGTPLSLGELLRLALPANAVGMLVTCLGHFARPIGAEHSPLGLACGVALIAAAYLTGAIAILLLDPAQKLLRTSIFARVRARWGKST
jgi:polysaccharide transporter, PST family